MRYFIHLAYKGTDYSGWQWQKVTPNTVQQKIEDALTIMLKSPVKIIGCGRTDAGVHASSYWAHFEYEDAFTFDPVYRLNRILPDDIAIYNIVEVHPRAHAQKDAIKRSYAYFINTRKNPFEMEIRGLQYTEEIDYDIAQMQMAVELIKKQTDFRAMCKSPNQYKHTGCTIFDCSLSKDEVSGQIVFRITANRFLQAMNRLLVGRLLDIGSGKMKIDYFNECLSSGIAPQFPIPAPPQGLFLTNVEYPFTLISNINS